MTVMRTEYWNLTTGTVRAGATGHGESLIDMESYLLPLEQAGRAHQLGERGRTRGKIVLAVAR